MTTATNPGYLHSFFSEPAEVRLLSPAPLQHSGYKLAYVFVSSRIYWKVTNGDGMNRPLSFIDFRNADSIELSRLDDGTWNDVHECVKVDSHDGRTRITVCGRPHGRTRRNTAFIVPYVRVEIIANTIVQHKMWLNRIRARIAPWNLLRQVFKDIASRAPSSEGERLENALGGLVTSGPVTNLSFVPTDEVEEKCSDYLTTFPEYMQKLSIVDELTAHGTAVVETGATLSKFLASVERVAEAAETVADVSKCVSGVSTIFHLLALSAQGVSMFVEANRGRKVLPIALGRIVTLLRYVLESMTEVIKQSRGVNGVDEDFVFDLLKVAVGAMDLAETQILRGPGREFLNAEDVKEVERTLDELKHKAVTAGNTARICVIDDKVNQLVGGRKICDDGLHHVRPSLSAFFSGRTRELDTLQEILERWGSAVIAQYGGVGKTELMIAFADRAERCEAVPGGVFWVTVDGDERDVIESIAGLAEKLARRKMGKEERRNPNLVLAVLKKGLDEREGRWLLCMDNADNSKVSGILNEVCGIAGGAQENGWVVVTSRQGQPHIWSRMKREQKLVLEPLSAEDAMVALWRQIRKIETDVADDDGIMNMIKELEKADLDEYRALKELSGDEGGRSLGGLPLALVQAGTYMARFECSFLEYRNLFENANSLENMQDIMRNIEEVKPIRESQRSILSTWKISVRELSDKAFIVLRAMAMLGPGGVGEMIVTRILEGVAAEEGRSVERMYRKVVIEELVQGSSLVYRDVGEGQGGNMYKMHRLVRRFVLSDMERGSEAWNTVYCLALVCVHETVEAELEKVGRTFRKLPDIFGNNHHEIGAHATALVVHHTLPVHDAEIRYVSKVEDIHRYCGMLMEFMGKAEEEIHVWERLLDILHYRQAMNRRNSKVQGLANMVHIRNQEQAEKSRIADVYNCLGSAFMSDGKLNDAASMFEHVLEMRQEIHGPKKPHPHIATSLDNLGSVYRKLGKLDKALEKHKRSLEMRLTIHGPHKPHPDIASSLNNLGLLYQALGQLDKALEMYERSLEMDLAIHGPHKPHPDIASSLNNLGLLYQDLGKLGKALKKHKQSLKMDLAIHGSNKPHPDIAASLSNLGNVYRKLGRLEKALEKNEQSLEMDLAIHGPNKPHPDIAKSLNNLGHLYAALGKLDKALEMYEQSLEMRLAIHGPHKPHPDIASSLNNLGSVYRKLTMLDKALEKHNASLDMYRAIHGPNKPHPDTALSLWNIGFVYHKLKNLDKAAEFLERSLEILRIVHGQNSSHPKIAKIVLHLADVYDDQGRWDEALALREEKTRYRLNKLR